MGYSPNPMNRVIPGFKCTEDEEQEIRRRAVAARMTLSKYLRDRALGKTCGPVETKPLKRAVG